MRRRWVALGMGLVVGAGLAGTTLVARAQRPGGGRGMPKSVAMVEVQLRPEPDTPLNRKLAAAVTKGDLEVVRDLLRQGASADARVTTDAPPEWKQPQEWTPMPLLASQTPSDASAKYRPIFRLLIEHVKEVDAADTRTGMTLLMAAADMDDLPSVQSLLARKADVNKTSSKIWIGASALTMAVMRGGDTERRLTPVIRALLDAGADVNVRYRSDPMGNPQYVEAMRKTPKDTGTTPLMIASQHGKTEVVQELLRRGADATVRDVLGHDALYYATRRRQDEVVALLRDRVPLDLHQAARVGTMDQVRKVLVPGADVNALDDRGDSPLLLASLREDDEVARFLIEAGAVVNVRDRNGATPLHRAAERGNLPLVRLLLVKGADPTVTVRQSQIGRDATPLMLAVSQARPEVVAALLPVTKDPAQRSRAFELAVFRGGQMPSPPTEARRVRRTEEEVLKSWERVLDLLLKAGVEVRANGSRALYLAASRGQPGLVRMLLDRGADPNARGQRGDGFEEGMTALMAAISEVGMDEEVEEGVQAGTIMGPERGAHAASAKHALEAVRLLLARGAKVDLADERGRTPLYRTVEYDMPAMTKLLLQHRAKVDLADADGRTPLMLAAAEGNLKIARMLLAQRANVNARDRQGRTALMQAIDDGRNEEYRQNRAETDEHMTHHGQAPRPIRAEDLPNRDGRPEMVRLLLKHGADRKVRSLNRETAEGLARKNRFEKVLAILRAR